MLRLKLEWKDALNPETFVGEMVEALLKFGQIVRRIDNPYVFGSILPRELPSREGDADGNAYNYGEDQ